MTSLDDCIKGLFNKEEESSFEEFEELIAEINRNEYLRTHMGMTSLKHFLIFIQDPTIQSYHQNHLTVLALGIYIGRKQLSEFAIKSTAEVETPK